MAPGSAKLVELKGMQRDPDEVESGELEEVEQPLKEAEQSLGTMDYVLRRRHQQDVHLVSVFSDISTGF